MPVYAELSVNKVSAPWGQVELQRFSGQHLRFFECRCIECGVPNPAGKVEVHEEKQRRGHYRKTNDPEPQGDPKPGVCALLPCWSRLALRWRHCLHSRQESCDLRVAIQVARRHGELGDTRPGGVRRRRGILGTEAHDPRRGHTRLAARSTRSQDLPAERSETVTLPAPPVVIKLTRNRASTPRPRLRSIPLTPVQTREGRRFRRVWV